jgi:glycosyltransferase involved in cell wall biosynthesis
VGRIDAAIDNSAVFVIVPAYNEGSVLVANMRPVIEAGYSVVVVDDGSSDDTRNVAGALPRAHVLRHELNLGQGAALQTGMTYALRAGARYIVHFDADGQHRVDDIPVLLEPLVAGEADVVLGSRFLRQQDTRAVPTSRRWLLRGGVVVNRVLTGVRLTDAHNGFRAFTAEAAGRIDLKENGFAHASEILSQIRRRSLRHVERPTSIEYSDYSRAKGQSSLNAVRIVVDLVLRRIFR